MHGRHHFAQHRPQPAGSSCPQCGHTYASAGYCPSCQPQEQTGFGRRYGPPAAGWGYGPQAPWLSRERFCPTPATAPTRPKTDDEIQDAVYQTLRNDPRIQPESKIAVEAKGGVVTLTGEVTDKFTKWAAGGDALCIPAVVDVVNNLRIAGGQRGAPSA